MRLLTIEVIGEFQFLRGKNKKKCNFLLLKWIFSEEKRVFQIF
jgi:hypothetical protein